MRDIYDSLEGWPKVELQNVSELMTRFHPGETEVVVHIDDRSAVTFFLTDEGLENLRLAIVERQTIRIIQRITDRLDPDGHCTNCSRSERCGGMGKCK